LWNWRHSLRWSSHWKLSEYWKHWISTQPVILSQRKDWIGLQWHWAELQSPWGQTRKLQTNRSATHRSAIWPGDVARGRLLLQWRGELLPPRSWSASLGISGEMFDDYFPDWLLVVDESPFQCRKFENVRWQARKRVPDRAWISRLPSATDSLPTWRQKGVLEKGTPVYICFRYALEIGVKRSQRRVMQQVIRPTGVVDPELFVRPPMVKLTTSWVKIKERVDRRGRWWQRWLSTWQEDLMKYLQDQRGIGALSALEKLTQFSNWNSPNLREGKFDGHWLG